MSEIVAKIGKEKMISLVGLILLGISAFLPWVWFTYLFGGMVTLSGFEVAQGEVGIFALIFAILGSLVILAYPNIKHCGYMCIGFAIWMLIEIAVFFPQISDIVKAYPWGAGIGAGLYLCVIGAIIVFFGGVLMIKVGKIKVELPESIQETSQTNLLCEPSSIIRLKNW